MDHTVVHHHLRNAESLAEKRKRQLAALETLATTLLRLAPADDAYQIIAQSLVQELHWDAAVIINTSPPKLLAAFHLTERQRRIITQQHHHLAEYFAPFHHETFSTHNRDDAASLGIRVLLQTKEVAGARFGTHGWLIACAHTHRNLLRDEEDVQFLRRLGRLAEHVRD